MKKQLTDDKIFEAYLNHLKTPDFMTAAMIKYYKQFNVPFPTASDIKKIMSETVDLSTFNTDQQNKIIDVFNSLIEYYDLK